MNSQSVRCGARPGCRYASYIPTDPLLAPQPKAREQTPGRRTTACQRSACFTCTYKVLHRVMIDLVSWTRRESKRGGTGIPMICMSCFCRMLRISGMWFDDVCFVVALEVAMLSLFDFLLCTNYPHMHCDYCHKGKSLKRCCRCTASVLYCCCVLISWLRG